MRRYVIIGSGVAGISAADTIRLHEPGADILPIGEEPQGFYSRPGLAYYLTGELPERQLFPFSESNFREKNLRILNSRVLKIYPLEHELLLGDGGQVPYDRLLLATGARAAGVKVPGIDLPGVIKLDNLEDARKILTLARKARSAVVVGGGITALEIVEGLIARKVKTHYFLRGDRYWRNVLDETESRIVEDRLKHEGVQIHYNTEMAEILGKRGKVAGVRTRDGRQIPSELIGIAVGVIPRIELAKAAGLRVDRGILVNECLQTSDPDIFAAGDVAQVFDPFSGKSILDSLWGPAREQGRIAGLNMAGQEHPYNKTVAFNVTRLAGLTTTIIGKVGHGRDEDLQGIARGDSETWRELPDAFAAQSNFEVNRLRILIGENTLIGAVVIGDQTLSRPLQKLVSERVDISTIRARLLEPGAAIADILLDFWSQLQISSSGSCEIRYA